MVNVLWELMKNNSLPDPHKKQQKNSAFKYSGMAFQILACVLLGFWGGTKLDIFLGLKKIPIFTLVLGLLGVVAGIYLSIKDFLKKK